MENDPAFAYLLLLDKEVALAILLQKKGKPPNVVAQQLSHIRKMKTPLSLTAHIAAADYNVIKSFTKNNHHQNPKAWTAFAAKLTKLIKTVGNKVQADINKNFRIFIKKLDG